MPEPLPSTGMSGERVWRPYVPRGAKWIGNLFFRLSIFGTSTGLHSPNRPWVVPCRTLGTKMSLARLLTTSTLLQSPTTQCHQLKSYALFPYHVAKHLTLTHQGLRQYCRLPMGLKDSA
ncbi:hypothetical protein ElyMa_001846900 [Elysia marginata]|uniref:Uncharacterized protein n=1 Tax=Elysia marginata TaxID=1093978 RepID=A0AAV4ELU6_9GAST|nr:hypothetical protein ElyMa_001846900 [Elysia marginata]